MEELKHNKGFTVIEMIVYVGVLTLILVGVINMAVAVSSTFSELRATRQLNQTAVLLFDRFVRETRDAEFVVTGQSTFGESPGVLTLDQGTAPDVQIYIENGTVKIDRGGFYEGDLTPSGVVVTNLIFRHLNNNPPYEAVRMEVTLESTSGSGFASETFYNTGVLRGAYGL